ncbi:polyketide synthase, partial [Chromobacterium alticapitis]
PARTRFLSAPTPAQAPTLEPIAIVGISADLPGAPDFASLWPALRDGLDAIRDIPDSRWDWDALFGDPLRETNKTNARRAGLIDAMEAFDPLFFGISPREAEAMDPQQRLLMTHVWKVIEDAGYNPHSLAGSDTALFIGTGPSGYASLLDR